MLVQFSNVGKAVTNARVGDVNARTAFLRISCEPAPTTTFLPSVGCRFSFFRHDVPPSVTP